ncbi:MAG TPA: GNAT family N-acetyltransferase [Acidimicrobiia bacterium]|nr:GNAT family N-acetyltransferase [Acidimicrobiia bacterium]
MSAPSAAGGGYRWVLDQESVDWAKLSELYPIAPLGVNPPDALQAVFSNSMYKSFVYSDETLVGAGRAIADGLDGAYIADVTVHPDYQGEGLGKAIITRLIDLARGHKKLILYANPGTEGFYVKLGFLPMKTALAIWDDRDLAIEKGLPQNL